MKIYKTKIIWILAVLFFFTACGPKKVDYKEVSLSSSKEEMVEAVGSNPNDEIQEENGGTSFVYKKSQLLSYTGTMSYHYYENVFLYTRWDYTAKKEEDIQKAYQEICENFTKECGEGVVDTKLHSTHFDTDSKNVVVAYSEEDTEWKLSVTTMMK